MLLGYGCRQFLHECALRTEEAQQERFALGELLAVVDAEAHRDVGAATVGSGLRGDVVVAHGKARRGVEVHLAEDARHAEHVLALEVGAVGPAEHLHGQRVGPRAQVGCHVELGHVVGSLRVAHILPVEPHEGC